MACTSLWATAAVAPSSRLTGARPAPAERLDETVATALAGLLAKALRDERHAPVARVVEVLDDRLHGIEVVMVDDAETLVVGFTERGEDHRNVAVEQDWRQ